MLDADQKNLPSIIFTALMLPDYAQNQDLADRLTLLRLSDVDDLEEVLRAREQQTEEGLGSSKYRQKATNPAPAATTKHVCAVQIRTVESESESGSDGSDGSDSDGDNHRRIYLAAEQDVTTKVESGMEKVEQVPITHKSTDQAPPDHRSRIQSGDPIGTVVRTVGLRNIQI
ncbi:LOW QUALITY PROTEIN: Hypothetical protein PHPALM_7783 [Phytophthora palmivora]|uniref:Uncharacterized protein n=1 Tax=Phytophthora palmivora TaxID=4796 RepID=A0A2P4YBJ0_9STRA|nr:LOW QUALITY PROTEIN: Hypothetical protein PHPALM_7783 [Phytophthora palmivora]